MELPSVAEVFGPRALFMSAVRRCVTRSRAPRVACQLDGDFLVARSMLLAFAPLVERYLIALEEAAEVRALAASMRRCAFDARFHADGGAWRGSPASGVSRRVAGRAARAEVVRARAGSAPVSARATEAGVGHPREAYRPPHAQECVARVRGGGTR